MSKLMSLDKQLEEKAKKWLLKQQKSENRNMAKQFFEENKKEVIEDYLENHPKVKDEYIAKKATWLKIKKWLVLGTITVGTLAKIFTHTTEEEPYVELPRQEEQVGDNNKVGEEKNIEEVTIEEEVNIEQEEEIGENNEPEIENKDKYENFFASARSIDNRYDRDDLITKQTKKIMVEAYNKKNPDNPITVDRFQFFILNEFVLEKTDKLGNVTYERVPQNVQYEFTDTQRLVKIGDIYDFRIDGETVAVFDKYGNVLPDKNVENPDMTFGSMKGIIDRASKLKDIYKYPSTEEEKKDAEKDYMITANGLLNNNEKENIIKDVEQEK